MPRTSYLQKRPIILSILLTEATPYSVATGGLETWRNCKTLQHTATHCNILQHTATHYPPSERVSRTESKTLCLQSSFHSFVSCAYVTNFMWWGCRSATVLHTIKMRLHHELHVMRMQTLYVTNFIWWGCRLHMSRTSYDEDADSICHELHMMRMQTLYVTNFMWWGCRLYMSRTSYDEDADSVCHELHVMRMQTLYVTNFIWWGCRLYMSRTSYDEDADSICHELHVMRMQTLCVTNFIWWGCRLYVSRTSYDEDADSICHELHMMRMQTLYVTNFIWWGCGLYMSRTSYDEDAASSVLSFPSFPSPLFHCRSPPNTAVSDILEPHWGVKKKLNYTCVCLALAASCRLLTVAQFAAQFPRSCVWLKLRELRCQLGNL